jgi:tetratricopeptide (TPR) repeat protein
MLAIVFTALAGCASAPKPAATITSTPPTVLTLPGYPQSLLERPTTSAENVLAHLDGRIAQATGDSARERAIRSGALYQRYQILGAMADLDEAHRLAQELSSGPDATTDTLLLWATIASFMHQFDAAIGALDRVAGPEQAKTDSLREDIARARTMRPILALPAQLPAGKELALLQARAADCVDQGDLNCASENFHRAQFFYHDSGPLPLAWLHTQQGITLLRFDHPDWAIRFFRAALERVPNYYLAAEHLAECLGLTGQYDEGRAVYLKVIQQTGNPEYIAGLAALERLAGNTERADVLVNEAKAGFAERLTRFPDAYALHAVEFYLDIGDQATAERLSARNLALRQDASAWLLQATVDLAGGRDGAACASLNMVRKAGYQPPEYSDLLQQLPRCDVTIN